MASRFRALQTVSLHAVQKPRAQCFSRRASVSVLASVFVFSCLVGIGLTACAQAAISAPAPEQIEGRVLDAQGRAVADVTVHLQGATGAPTLTFRTDGQGAFHFTNLSVGAYTVDAEQGAAHTPHQSVQLTPAHPVVHLDLTLVPANASAQAMQFADDPNFTVAGVTDWTAAGGHGSDSSLRTSEALTRETLSMRSGHEPDSRATAAAPGTIADLRAQVTKSPRSFDANARLGRAYLDQGRYKDALPWLQAAYEIDPSNAGNEMALAEACKDMQDWTQARAHVAHLLAAQNTAAVHRLAAEVDEAAGDPLSAVREYETAAKLDPSEQNYFDWGSELLFHRAVLQARQVFEQGVKAYPNSSRMLVALGGTLFANALYDDAARSLCQASDLDPSNREPYLFMGRIEVAAPTPLPCIAEKLAHFAQVYPDDSLAHYYYAMALWKQLGPAPGAQSIATVQAQLLRAVTIDPQCADGYLQLGNLKASQRSYQDAVADYQKAIQADPQLAEAHYRLGLAYDRLGERELAEQQFALHQSIRKEQAAQVDRQRKEIKQFLVTPASSQPAAPQH